ncbi:hypothetical protein [Pseudomonas silensiensis]|uniref:hypothetical protein n=1 Tax=Pseudomonas silensiensis TaxID=2991049 RepID=UPI003D1F9281
MKLLDEFRVWVSRNLAPIIFLSAYFFTVVLGNIIYSFPFGKVQLLRSEYTADILSFDTLFSSGYWVLLFLPFVLTPLVVVLVRKVLGGVVLKLSSFVIQFSKVEYLFILVACYGIVLFALLKADAFLLFLNGADAVASVVARFKIRSQVGFIPLMVLMSLLHFLSIYSFVRWMRERSWFWGGASVFNSVVMSAFLIMLNMKWPILIFYAGLVLAIFVYAKRYAYLKTALGGVLLITVYFLISAFVFRLAATESTESTESSVSTGSTGSAVEASAIPSGPRTKIVDVGAAAATNAPMLIFAAVNRMAIIYPYYYEVFTREGAVCGGILAQAKIGPACRPSTFIYTRMFNDSFNGRGTAPAAVHISGYALGGWPVAIGFLVCASLVLGLFTCLPLQLNAVTGSLAITGAIAGYHYSQLPLEGPIIYDHGLLWVFLLLFVFVGYRYLLGVFRGSSASLEKQNLR